MNSVIFRISCTFLCCLFFSTSSLAQFKALKEAPLNISYFGHEYFQPGIKIGTQFHILEWEKEKRKNKKLIRKSFFLSPQVGLNIHDKNHAALLLNMELGLQRKYASGWFSAFSIGLGDLIQFNWGTTYVLQDDSSIEEEKWASRSYFLPSLNLELGKEINSKVAIFGKFTGAGKMNYNTIALIPQIFWELGVKLSL